METYQDSMGILTGAAPRLDQLGTLHPSGLRGRDTDEDDFLSGDATGFSDSLGLLGPPTQPAIKKPWQREEAPKIKDSLGILSSSAEKLKAPEQVESEAIEAEISKRLGALHRSQFTQSMREQGVPETEIEKELGGLQEPWVDPLTVGASGFGFGAKFAAGRGAKAFPAIGRGIAAALPGMATEYPLGQFVDSFAEGNEEVALLAAIGLGLVSGMSVETLAERGLLKVARNLASKHPAKAAAVLPPEVIEKFKLTPKAEVSEEIAQNVLDVQAARLERRKADALARQQAAPKQQPVIPEPEIPQKAMEAPIEDILPAPKPAVTEILPEAAPIKDSLGILTPGKVPVTIEEATGTAQILAREAQAKRAEQAGKAKSFRQWVSLTGGVNPKDPSWGGELRELARDTGKAGRTVRRVPPGFYNVQARSLDERVTDAVDAGWLRRGATDQDFFDLLESNPTKRLRDVELELPLKGEDEFFATKKEMDEVEALTPDREIYLHPSTITGPLGGIAAGVDWEALKEGEIKIDPKKALYGALAGAAGGAAIPKARRLASNIAHTWEERFAAPFIDFARSTINGAIVNEDIRHGLGMGRSKVFQKMLREYRRDVETLWNQALELGQDLARLAPTPAEQKRLLQVARGSLTGSAEMRKKADEVRLIFDELRKNLEEHQLLTYSRFDKLTKAERAATRKKLSGPDPIGLNNRELSERARELNVTIRQPFKRDDVLFDIRKALEFEKEKLDNHYHWATAQSYTPRYYGKVEGLTPLQRSALEAEVNKLKTASRRGRPEGDPKLEEQIARMEQMLGKGAESRKQLRSTFQGLVKSYAHMRLDLPPQVEKLLEPIHAAPYPISKGVGIQKVDLRKAALYEEIAKEVEWVRRPGPGVTIPANFTIVENEAFGALNGLAVRRDVLSDLKEIEETRGYFVRNWDRFMGLYRTGKAVWNPATQARNFVSNILLSYFGDVPMTDLKTYSKAFKAIRAGDANPFYREAHEWGLYNNSFVASEISALRDDFSALRDPSQVKNWIRRAIALPAKAYGASEELFKTAVYLKGREAGLSVDEAAEKAQKYLFDYSATSLPPWARQMRRWIAPFFTWTYHSTGLFADTAIRKPWKIAGIGALMYAAEELSKYHLGMSEDEYNTQRGLLPQWMKTKIPPVVGRPSYVLMPFKNDWGDNLYLDLQFIIPYAGLSDRWGQSPIPFGDLFPNSPLFNIASAIATNRQGFTGRKVYDEILDSASDVLTAYFDLAWKELTPSLAPGGYGYNKLATAIKNQFTDEQILDWSGKPQDMQTAILSTIFGLKLTPANIQKLRQLEASKRRQISAAVSDEVHKLKRDRDRNIITADEFKEHLDRLIDLKRKLLTEREGK